MLAGLGKAEDATDMHRILNQTRRMMVLNLIAVTSE